MRFFTTHISDYASDLALSVLRSTYVSEGAMVRKFENALASDLGLSRPAAVNSGTSALHLAMDIVGVGPRDEVILPAQTFVATGLVILMHRAKPVFADIEPFTGNISADSIVQKMSIHTRAIIPVHWAGYPCDLDEINAIARAHRVAVIEDGAHALG